MVNKEKEIIFVGCSEYLTIRREIFQLSAAEKGLSGLHFTLFDDVLYNNSMDFNLESFIEKVQMNILLPDVVVWEPHEGENLNLFGKLSDIGYNGKKCFLYHSDFTRNKLGSKADVSSNLLLENYVEDLLRYFRF